MANDIGLSKKEEEQKEDKSKEVLVLEHALTVEDENYKFPSINFLKAEKHPTKLGQKAVTDAVNKLQKTLYSFGVSAKVENVSVGPTTTRYELKPDEGVRVSKIKNLANDIALSFATDSIRIEAPIPGKHAIGIEIPNPERGVVLLRDIIDSKEFKEAKSKLSVPLGKNMIGEVVLVNIEEMPHLLIAGNTGSGKSVFINSLITSILYKAKPDEVKLLLINTRMIGLSLYNGLPHLLIPIITESEEATGALTWAVQEMTNRYYLFKKNNVKNIMQYNEVIKKNGTGNKLPQIVIIIEDFADLISVDKENIEDCVRKLVQMSKDAGIYLIITTQRASVKVITGTIKANIPSRIAFTVSSQTDSQTILDVAGAEKLLGNGDMLFSKSRAAKSVRIQGAFISEGEVEKIVTFLKENDGPTYREDVVEKIEKVYSTDKELEKQNDDETDPFLMDAIDAVIDLGQASASFIQRRFKVGYARAGRIINQMEARGIISGYEGSNPRQVLISKAQWEELKMSKPITQQELSDSFAGDSKDTIEKEIGNIPNNNLNETVNKESVLKKWWFWALTIIFILIILGNL